MLISEILSNDISFRKIVWSKRGDKIVRKVVDKKSEFDIRPITRIEIKKEEKK